MTDQGEQLLHEVQAAIERYVILPSVEHAHAVTLWIAATHAAPAWNTAARLVIRAPEKRCGKSRLLDIIEATCHQPVMTVNASPSAIYRLIATANGNPPTVLIDEADTIFGPKAGDNEDLRGLLNAGHQRGRPALRWDASTRAVETLDTYAMAALAGIGRLPDTIEDRAVIIPMRRRAPGEHVLPYRQRRDSPPLAKLRHGLHIWARRHQKTLTKAMPEMPLEDREADTWESLIAIADQAAGPWPDLARAAAIKLTKQAVASTTGSLTIELLADIQTALITNRTLSTEALLTMLKQDPESPWATHGPNGLNPRTLAMMLKEFNITSRNIRANSAQFKGYSYNDFVDTWDRYLPTINATQSGENVVQLDPGATTRPKRPTRPKTTKPQLKAYNNHPKDPE